ncbi:MAG: CDP-alcohol phosphatidyltransferase family protein [Desulfovibrionales bacterium]
MSLRETAIARFYSKNLEKLITPLVQKHPVSPNTVTFLGFALAGLVPFGFLVHELVGCFLILLSGWIDTLDGLVSRVQNRKTRFGAFWDSTLDRFSDSFYLVGFWLLFRDLPLPQFMAATLFVFAAMVMSLLISYTKARIEGLGGTCEGGMAGRPVRVIYLILWALLLGVFPGTKEPLLWSGLVLYIFLTAATVLQRVLTARRELSREG